MSAALKAVRASSELVEIRDALSIEIVPMLDALHTFARFSGALRDVAAAIESDPALGQRLRAGGPSTPRFWPSSTTTSPTSPRRP